MVGNQSTPTRGMAGAYQQPESFYLAEDKIRNAMTSIELAKSQLRVKPLLPIAYLDELAQQQVERDRQAMLNQEWEAHKGWLVAIAFVVIWIGLMGWLGGAA